MLSFALPAHEGQAVKEQKAEQKNPPVVGLEGKPCWPHSGADKTSAAGLLPQALPCTRGRYKEKRFRKNAAKRRNGKHSAAQDTGLVNIVKGAKFPFPQRECLGQRFVCKIAQVFPCGQRPVFYLFAVSHIGLVSHFAVVLHYLIKPRGHQPMLLLDTDHFLTLHLANWIVLLLREEGN